MPTDRYIPVHRLLITYLKKGFEVLDQQAQQEIIVFLKQSQHTDGGFTDRAGYPDLYYSLFGSWLAQATGQEILLDKLKSYIEKQNAETLGVVEQMALLLIRSDLEKDSAEISAGKLFKLFFQQGKNIHLSYRFFLFTLVFDAIGKRKQLYYFIARIGLYFYKSKSDFPSSLMAALLFARKKLGLRHEKSKQKLLDFALESGGFKSFLNIKNADMLSTGVALFSLAETKADLRLLKPASLGFIQENFIQGAFLSGDGDQTRDLEYTFYGLLALGSLVKDEREMMKD